MAKQILATFGPESGIDVNSLSLVLLTNSYAHVLVQPSFLNDMKSSLEAVNKLSSVFRKIMSMLIPEQKHGQSNEELTDWKKSFKSMQQWSL